MIKSKVIQWGNSLAIKLPKSARELINIDKGDDLNIYVTDKQELIIRKADSSSPIFDKYDAGSILYEGE